MSEPKPFASLSSGLLARKGGAKPAMRPQGFSQLGASLEDLGWNDMGFEAPRPAEPANRDEDHDAFGEVLAPQPLRNPVGGLTPIGPAREQQRELSQEFGEDAPRSEAPQIEADEPRFEESATVEAEPIRPVAAVVHLPVAHLPVRAVLPVVLPAAAPEPRAEGGAKAKAAFTLRLDPSRHMRLRLATAVRGRSAQRIVTEALDAYLAAIPELDSMANQLPANHGARRT